MLAAHLLAVRCCPAHVLAAAAVRVSALLHVPQLDNAVSVSSRHHLICGNSSSSGVGSQPQQRRCSARRQLHSMPASLPDVAPAASRRLVLALLQEELAALSIPARDLQKLAASPLSDAAITAYALTKTHGHPAADQAAAAQARLSHLLAKLDGAMLRQQAAGSSPTAQLLWRVALAAARAQIRAMPPDELQQCVEHQAVAALLRSQQVRSGVAAADVLSALERHLPQLVDASPRNTLGHAAFWQLAQVAAQDGARGNLLADLQLTHYHLAAAAAAAAAQLQQVEQLLGVSAAALQQALREDLPLGQDRREQVLGAVAAHSTARATLAQLQLIETLAAALGLSCVQLTGAVSSCELVRRLTSLGQAAPAVSPALEAALQAAVPALVAAVQQAAARSLAQPSVSALLQLMASRPELQAAHTALTAWRADAAAAGALPVLTTLTQSEVAALSAPQAAAVARHVVQLEAAGRMLARTAAAGQLALQELTSEDAAALAWRVHTGGEGAAEELVGLLLAQAADVAAAQHAEVSAAESALHAMAAGFQLEEATSRRSTAAPPPPYVMAGIPQLQVAELSEGMPALPSSSSSSSSSSNDGATLARVPIGSAEALVRDLALLLTPPSDPAAVDSQQAAAQRLQYAAHDLPQVLRGPLLELLGACPPTGGAPDAASLRRQQQSLRALAAVLAAELPQLVAAGAGGAGGGPAVGWSGAAQLSDGSRESAEGLLELLGEQDMAGALQHAAQQRGGAHGQAGHLYGWLADVHHDIHMQRYLQMEFDPQLEVELNHAPRGWQDAELHTSPAAFLQGMRPLLDAYLAAQGEAALQDVEWQVYCDAALAEAEVADAAAAAVRRTAGHSPFHNSKADEAFLRARLEAGIPASSVLHAAAHKHLGAALRNRTWRFAQRKRLVDLLIRIAAHLAAHPPRSYRGSPFSALFTRDGPPLVPRISLADGDRAGRGGGAAAAARQGEVYALPDGFGSAPVAAATAVSPAAP